MRALSAILFLTGAMVMVIGGTCVWVFLMASIMLHYGPGFGLLAVALSVPLINHFWPAVAWPWHAWFIAWQRMDEAVCARKGPGA